MNDRAVPSVHVGVVHPEHVSGYFFISFSRFLFHDAHHEGYVMTHGGWDSVLAGPRLADARNTLVRHFLHATDHEWLWMLDADMTFEPETLARLIAVADPDARPIVGALCFGKGAAGEVFTTMILFDEAGDPRRLAAWDRGKLVEVNATGAACLLVHRSVLERIGDTYPEPFRWFSEGVNRGRSVGEDTMFCYRAGELGIPIWVHTGVEVGHHKSVIVTTGTYDAWIATRRPQLPVRQDAPDEPTYVVVPVKDRHEMTRDLLASLIGSGDFAHVDIFDNGSEAPAAKALAELASGAPEVEILDRPAATVYQLWNEGLDRAAERARAAGHEGHNVALLNNDLRVPPQFLADLARALRSDDRLSIVYPNYDSRPLGDSVMELTEGCAAPGTMSGFAFMVKGETGLRVDEQFEWWYGDNDLERQAREAGGLVACAGSTWVVHLEPNRSTAESPDLQERAQRDRERYRAKYGDEAPR